MKEPDRRQVLRLTVTSLFLGVLLLLGCSDSHAQTRLAIHVFPETSVTTDQIELGAISKITGESDVCGRLGRIGLGYAPNVGMTREIMRDQITMALSAAGISSAEVALDAPPRVLIHRVGQTVAPDEIRGAIKLALMKQFSTDQITADITGLTIPDKIEVPVGNLDIRVGAVNIRDMFSSFSLPVEVAVAGRTVRRFAATVTVEAFGDVVVAAADLTANSKLMPGDLRLEKRRLERSAANYIRDPARLHGVVMTRSVASGTVITSDLFVAGIVIRSGDAVRIEAQSGNLKFIIRGEARGSGRIGDRIAVKNSQSGAILQAVVVDEGLVRINL